MKTLRATEIIFSFETIEALCPHCNNWSIYNRASDLKTLQKISGLDVTCFNDQCKKTFRILGDLINPSWQMLIRDCSFLKQRKKYSYCILNVCQAYEMYFSFYLRTIFLYKPFETKSLNEIMLFNRASQLLYDTTKEWTYSTLRNTVIQQMVKNTIYLQSEVENEIKKIKNTSRTIPTDESIKNISNKQLSDMLIELKSINIGSLRNHVVHKNGYCPTIEEVEEAEEKAGILYRLDNYFGLLSYKYHAFELH